MAGITTMALFALSAAKTGLDYSNQRRAAGAAAREGDLAGAQFDRNAGLLDLEAKDALDRGASDALKVRGAARQLAGSQRAAMAAQGIDLNSGSAADVVENDQRLSDIDIVTIRNNARKEAWGIQVQAQDARYQGELARTAGRNQARSIRSQSAGTLLSGAAELASIYQSAPKSPKQTYKPDPHFTASGARRGGPL